MINLDLIGLFILLAGFIIGLGAVTVIDIHGFLGRKSSYWTEATTRTHKVTKPLIWVGIFLAIIGGILFFRNEPFSGAPMYLSLISIVLVLNGLFLSFRVSPYLLQKEKEGRASELLPESWQRKIIVGLILSDLGWWGSLALVVWYLVTK
ncbi:MAG: hypothetical protein NTZ20_04005 [Candidatus Levybacteria bacterium]|nr:hypothetical protein [Candidatus Levybacteria bacterium]